METEGDEALMTACGRNLIRAEINRNKQSVLWTVATIEVAEMGERLYRRCQWQMKAV